MRLGTEMPPLEGATEWVNGGPIHRADLMGRPALVQFWAISCHGCHQMMPAVVEWHAQFAPQGLQMVGIHQPRSEEDTRVDAVTQAIQDYGISYPIAIDNEHKIADAWENRFLPAFYLFDREGKLRHFQAGDRGQKMLLAAIERVLAAEAVAPTVS